MSVINTQFSTITCDNCKKTVIYPATEEQAILSLAENAWVVKTARLVQNLIPAPGQNRPNSYLYCGDECEATAVGTGTHNVPEPKKIIAGGASADQVARAAQAAQAAERATQALKAGQPNIVTG